MDFFSELLPWFFPRSRVFHVKSSVHVDVFALSVCFCCGFFIWIYCWLRKPQPVGNPHPVFSKSTKASVTLPRPNPLAGIKGKNKKKWLGINCFIRSEADMESCKVPHRTAPALNFFIRFHHLPFEMGHSRAPLYTHNNFILVDCWYQEKKTSLYRGIFFVRQ